MSTADFWDDAASKNYDVLVLGDDAPNEIRSFIRLEDKRLDDVISSYIKKNKDVIFVEIGSGTGRYLRYFGEKIICFKKYEEHLKYVIGVDFSKKMIEASIENLVHTRKVNEQTITSLADLLARKMNFPIEKIREKLASKVVVMYADASKPFLRVVGANVVVGIMFGTLGNIGEKERKKVLSNVCSMLEESKGKAIITVFDKVAMKIGYEVYNELASKGFTRLGNIKFRDSDFTSPKGFYSHWFSLDKFNTLLENQFKKRPAIESIGARGLLAIAEPKTFRPTKKTKPGIYLLCPSCGETIGTVPLRDQTLTCDHCKVRYIVKEFRGFRFPVLISAET